MNRPATLSLSAHCGACGHAIVSAREPLESRGEAFPVPDLAPLLQCMKCGARGGTVQVQARHFRPDGRRS